MTKYIAIVWTDDRRVNGQWRYELIMEDAVAWARKCRRVRKFKYEAFVEFNGDIVALKNALTEVLNEHGCNTTQNLRYAIDSVLDYMKDMQDMQDMQDIQA